MAKTTDDHLDQLIREARTQLDAGWTVGEMTWPVEAFPARMQLRIAFEWLLNGLRYQDVTMSVRALCLLERIRIDGLPIGGRHVGRVPDAA